MEKKLKICDTCKEEGRPDTVAEFQCEVCSSDICRGHAYPFTMGLTSPTLDVATLVVCDLCRKGALAGSKEIQSILSKSKKVLEEFREAVKKGIEKEK